MIISAMENHRDVEYVQAEGCIALYNISCCEGMESVPLANNTLTLFVEPEIFQYFDKHEYVDLLASTMERHKTNKEIQKFACELMEYLFELRHNGTENGVIC